MHEYNQKAYHLLQMQPAPLQDAARQLDTGPRAATAVPKQDANPTMNRHAAAPAVGQKRPAAELAADPDVCEEEEEEWQEGQQQEESSQEAGWQEQLWDALSAAVPQTKFACSGTLSGAAPFPEVTVAGVGRLDLPLSQEQAASLRAVTEQAPHGKGLRTLVDTAVRDAHQVDASRVTLSSSWQPQLQQLVAKVAASLGLSDEGEDETPCVEARLYKLLLYQQGGHFSPHQDTEKEPGMVGTLVVQLPCAQGHTGGSLIVRHKGKSHTHKFAEESDRSLQYAAFFADCEHELSPVTGGVRLVLVYNLVWVGPGQQPQLQGRSAAAKQQLRRALKAWEAELAAGGRQRRLAFLLCEPDGRHAEHEYTQANLRFEHLKGRNRAMARALTSCRGLEPHLVLIQRTLVSTIEEDDYYPYSDYGRRGYCSDDEDEEGEEESGLGDGRGEVLEDYIECKWVGMGGAAASIDYGSIEPDEDYWDPEGAPLFRKDDDPDDEEDSYTGNEGATREQIYRRTLLVVWPRSQGLTHAARAGFPAMLALLNMRVQDAVELQGTQQQQQQQAATTPAAAAAADAAAVDDTSDQQHRQQQESAEAPAAAAADRRAHKQKQAHREVLQVLRACVLHLKKCLQQAGSGISPEQPAAVLQQGVKAVGLGVDGAAAALQKLLLAIAAAPGNLLKDNALAAALGAAAGLLDAAAVGPALQRCVSSCMASQPSGCVAVIRGTASQAPLQQQLATTACDAVPTGSNTVQHLLTLALAVPDLPAVQQQVIAKVAAAVQEDGSAQTAAAVSGILGQFSALPQLQQGLTAAAAAATMAAGPASHLSSCGPILQACRQDEQLRQQFVQAISTALRSGGSSWQAGEAVPLLAALQDDPAHQQLLSTAVAEGMFTNRSLLAAQMDASMLQLSGMILQDKRLRPAYYDHFAAAVAQRPESYDLLKQLLRSAEVQAALSLPEVQQLVACQVANLERLSAVPAFTWKMPLASFPSNPQVETFLRGPDATLKLSGYSGIAAARKAAEALLPRNRPYEPYSGWGHSRGTYSTPTPNIQQTYSFTVVAAGIGKGAHVVLSKTRAWYDSLLKVKEGFRQELLAVRALRQRSSSHTEKEVILID